MRPPLLAESEPLGRAAVAPAVRRAAEDDEQRPASVGAAEARGGHEGFRAAQVEVDRLLLGDALQQADRLGAHRAHGHRLCLGFGLGVRVRVRVRG